MGVNFTQEIADYYDWLTEILILIWKRKNKNSGEDKGKLKWTWQH